VPEAPLNGTNPLNEDAPSSQQGFIEQFNNEAFQYIQQASGYQLEVQEVTAVNELGEQLINLVREHTKYPSHCHHRTLRSQSSNNSARHHIYRCVEHRKANVESENELNDFLSND